MGGGNKHCRGHTRTHAHSRTHNKSEAAPQTTASNVTHKRTNAQKHTHSHGRRRGDLVEANLPVGLVVHGVKQPERKAQAQAVEQSTVDIRLRHQACQQVVCCCCCYCWGCYGCSCCCRCCCCCCCFCSQSVTRTGLLGTCANDSGPGTGNPQQQQPAATERAHLSAGLR